jgi:single-stranded-DNA-specific exonuclease
MPVLPVPDSTVNLSQPPGSETAAHLLANLRLPNQRWSIHPSSPEVNELAASVGLSPILAQVLINRGFTTLQALRFFLEPESETLPSPLAEFPDLALSVELLETAIQQGDKIAICGDYDADGMTSTALLLRALGALGAKVEYAIPSRMQEGYGINERIVESFAAEGVRLILTVDNGIAAYAPIARARELGLNVIVTDHHDLPPELPPAHAILNPKLLPEGSPYGGLAGVGVAYVLAVALAQQMGETQHLVAPLLALFTLGTIADLAPLVGVNRRWLQRGLKLLPRSHFAGIQALIAVSGSAGNHKSKHAFKPDTIGFRLGPRINAVGRIGDPQAVIELLTTDDPEIAQTRALECESTNQERQHLCREIEPTARIGRGCTKLASWRHWHCGLTPRGALRCARFYWHLRR